MPEPIRPTHNAEPEADRIAHESIMARLEASREADRIAHESIMARLEALSETNRIEHKLVTRLGREMTTLGRLGREMTKLGVEFEQHRHDTKVLADGLLGLVRKNEALERTDAALDCRVTKLEVRASRLTPRARGRT